MSEETTDLLDEARVPMEVDAGPLVKQFISIEQVEKDTLINPINILNELLGLPSIFARYGLLLAKARIQRDGFKSRRNLLAAMVGLTDDDLAVKPPDGGWSVQEALEHIATNERNYLAVIREARLNHSADNE